MPLEQHRKSVMHCLLGWMKSLIVGKVIIECRRMVLSCSSGKTTSVFVFCPVFMGEISSVQRTQKDGSKFQFPCPEAVADYNKYMSEVDKADMLCSVQRLSRKSKKWWLRILFGIIDRTIINAQIAYSKIEGESISVLDYRRAVAQALIARAIPVRAGRPRSMPSQQEPTKRRKTDHSIGLEEDPVTERAGSVQEETRAV